MGRPNVYRTHATKEQVTYCRDVINNGDGLGHRGNFDGDPLQQLFGLIAETIVADSFGHDRPAGQGYDGGFDLVLDGKRFDVKCKITSVRHKHHYPHNLSGHQAEYQSDALIFVSYNKSTGEYEICGWIPKDEFKAKATWYQEGSLRPRSDGTYMPVKGSKGMYEIMDQDLHDMKELPGWQSVINAQIE